MLKNKKLFGLPYERRRSLAGYGFISLWLFGFFLLYVKPLLESLFYSFNRLKINPKAFDRTWVGLDNYVHALTKNEKFMPELVSALKDLAYQMPMILVFGLVMAMFINQKFVGRTIMRAVFFLPVVIASGVVVSIFNGDHMAKMILSGEKTSQLFQVNSFNELLYGLGFSDSIVNLIVSTTNNIFELSWKSGIQITLFLAGLQAIPHTLYEASSIDGGTKWEIFWKITFPMLMPIFLVNLVYTVTDNFMSYDNGVMRLILAEAQEKIQFHSSATMAWIYFLIIVLVLGTLYFFINRRVEYLD